nr:HAMP domain-containing sensor histidine kinase [Sulfobacillus harzensis]
MAHRLSTAEEARHEFLASVAHELKTPLAVLRGNLEGLAAGVLVPAPERWTALHREVTRLTRLVNDLLWLERAQGLAPPLQRTPYDPREQLEALVLRFRPLADSQGLTLTATLGDIPRVWADRDRIEQVLINILDNALRHTPAGGTIRIVLTQEDSRVGCWCVEDSGPGIAPALREHVREAFVRDPRSPGAGLGLAVADAWLRAHGGRLQIGPSRFGGARVCACIPVTSSATPEPTASADRPPSRR